MLDDKYGWVTKCVECPRVLSVQWCLVMKDVEGPRFVGYLKVM